MKDYLRSLRAPFIASLVLFLLFIGIGYSLGSTFPGLMKEIERFLGGFKGYGPFRLVALIFLNNSAKALLAILLGPLLAIFPLLLSAGNGLILGVVGFNSVNSNGIGFVLASVLPHGVLEIPAILLSTAIGIRLGLETIKKIRGKGKIIRELKRGLRFFFHRILLLLLLAAFVEVFVTPAILNLVA